jgi:hypothetical protein
VRIQRLRHASRHRRQRRLVKDDVDVLGRPFHLCRIQQIALDQLDVNRKMRKIQLGSAAQIVKDANFVAAFDQRRRDMRANEPGAARH